MRSGCRSLADVRPAPGPTGCGLLKAPPSAHARAQLVLGVEQIVAPLPLEHRAGVVDDQSSRRSSSSSAVNSRSIIRASLALHQPSVPGFHLRDDRQRQDVHQEGQHTRRQRDEAKKAAVGRTSST